MTDPDPPECGCEACDVPTAGTGTESATGSEPAPRSKSKSGSGSVSGASNAPTDPVQPRAVWTGSRGRRTALAGVFLAVGLLLSVSTAGKRVVVAPGGYGITLAEGLLLGAVVVGGESILRNGIDALRRRTYNVDALEAVAILAATALGMFVEAAVLAVLIGIAHRLEDYAVARTRASTNELLDLTPESARVRQNGDPETVPVESVSEDDVVVVKPGEKIPLDGTVVEGNAAVDESPITGESVPANKAPGDEVYAGTFVENGYLEVTVTAEAEDTTLARIVETVREARSNRPEIERYVDRLAAYYTPVIVVAALLVATVPPVVSGGPWRPWIVRGLTVLVIACPCAFVISTPVSVFTALSGAAKAGILVTGGKYLEALADLDVVALDKTGALTRGDLSVTDVVAAPGESEAALLGTAAGIEARSDHPIATAIVDHAQERGVDRRSVDDFQVLPGSGVRASVDGTTHFVGNPSLFDPDVGSDDRAVEPDGGNAPPEAVSRQWKPDVVGSLREEGKTVVLVGTETGILGTIALRDEVRPGAERAVERLHEAGVGTVVLTGDNEATARAVADDVGVDEYRAELVPEDKVEAVESLAARHDVTAMVGDGVNDAPALASASVGVAMGATGTDTAIETADVALMGDDLEGIPDALALGRSGLRVIKQNVWASLLVEGLLFVAASTGVVGPVLAVLLGDAGLTLAVTGNAIRLSSEV